MSSVKEAVKKGPYFPLGGKELPDKRATATCYCGTVQLSFPTEGKELGESFICNCHDCRKITASVFASNFIVHDTGLKHERGESKLTRFAQSKTIDAGNEMANYFCSVCGTLLYRRSTGFPGMSILRIGTVDDFALQETVLKPKVEQFVRDRVGWIGGGLGVEQKEGNWYDTRTERFKAKV